MAKRTSPGRGRKNGGVLGEAERDFLDLLAELAIEYERRLLGAAPPEPSA